MQLVAIALELWLWNAGDWKVGLFRTQ